MAHAFVTRRNVIPILVDDFKFPINLPGEMADLRTRNGIIYNDITHDSQISKMCGWLKSDPKEKYEHREMFVPSHYRTIQEAINSSSEGDTILIGPGIYQEVLTFKMGLRFEL